MNHSSDLNACEEPLVERLFSVIGRLGMFSLMLDTEQELTIGQLRILFRLYHRGPLSMGQIAEMLAVSGPTATGIVNRLVARELVTRGLDPGDRRVVHVSISSLGRERVEALRCAGAERALDSLSQLDENQRDALYQALAPLHELLLVRAGTAPE